MANRHQHPAILGNQLPVVLLKSASKPMAVLLVPLPLAVSALAPMAVLLFSPVVLLMRAPAPVAVLLLPLVKLPVVLL